MRKPMFHPAMRKVADGMIAFCRSTCLLLLSCLASQATTAWCQTESPPADTGPSVAAVRELLAKHCQGCHGAEQAKGDFRVDRLDSGFADESALSQWQKVLDRVRKGEMPPRPKPRPTDAEQRMLVEWIEKHVQASVTVRRAEGRVVLRRLNRVEYENTIRDLLGIQVELQDLLPLDTSSHGFDNIGEALHTSSFLMEKYLEAADKALDLAIANRPQPPLVKKRYSLKNDRLVQTTTEDVYRITGDTVVLFSSSPWNGITLGEFYPPDRGRYRIRISTMAVQSGDEPVSYRVDAGPMLMGTKNHLVGYFDALPEESSVVEFVDHFEARNHIRIQPYGLASANVVTKSGSEKYDGPGLAVEWVDVEGPLHDAWPPTSHRRIFGDLPQAAAPVYNVSDRVEVVSNDSAADSRRILLDFARRAFRRPVAEDEIAPLIELVERNRAEGNSFEQALRVGLTAVLVSPEFLFLRETPGRLDPFALASRLSYFLWSTMPDEELLALAEQRKLDQPEVLSAQVERMLQDPRAHAFTTNFVGQWLSLRDIDFTEPGHLLHPEFDDMLKVSMVRETELFFEELLRHDLSLANFVASDFTMLNGRLARHYGIPGVYGYEFRKTTLPPGSHRGGVMTMASVLKVTANGTSTSPVTRGAWVLDRILGTPPPRPPEDVAALQPDIRGATTIREQLAKHRQLDTCASCHTEIDPPGFALENFDVIGGWRDRYRLAGWAPGAEEVVVDGRRMPYYHGLKVDPADVLPDGRAFQNIDELKQLLLEDKDQLARALATRLLTYGTGGPTGEYDRPALEAIVTQARDSQYGFRSLIHAIVQSDLFQRK
ncbi:MAG: DUF1592 domain-containing protein [Pirellulales bacterium]